MKDPSRLSAMEVPDQARERIVSEEYASLIYRYQTSVQQLRLTLPEYLPQIADAQYAILNVPLADYPPDISRLGYFTIPKLFAPQDTVSLEVSGIPPVQYQPFLNLTGKNVLLGIIDTGINYQHPAFRNSDGTTRILSIWDQSIQTGSVPDGFFYGSEYAKEDIDQALISPNPLDIVPSTDEIGHGTAIAGIAGGTPDDTANFSGAAFDSDFLVVKLKNAKQYLRDFYLIEPGAAAYQEDDCMLAIRYLQKKARVFSRPLIICFGLGTNQGGHDGRTPLESVFGSFSSTAGDYAVAAGGNEAGRGHHYLGKISRINDHEDVEVIIDKETAGFTMELWAYAPDLFALGVISPQGETIPPVEPRQQASQTATFLLDRTQIAINYEVIELSSGSQLIQVRIQNPSVGIWRFRVENRRYTNGIFHIWLPITTFIAPGIRFLNPDPDTTLVIPSCNDKITTCSTYQATTGTLYLNSSRGFTRNDQIKPDISSPGVNIQVPSGTSGYGSFTGSSAAAAITGGAMALLVQWGLEQPPIPKLFSSTEIKNLLYRGAQRNENVIYPNREWGYGTLDVYGIFQSLIL